MFISDLIEELEKCMTEVGDVQVLMCDDYGNTDDFDCFTSNIFNPFNGRSENVVLLEM